MADDDTDLKPVEEDLRADDEEYNPNVEPESSKAWLNLLRESEKAFEEWNDRCDNIDKQFASLSYLCATQSRQGISTVLGELRGSEAEHLRQAAGAGCCAEVQGPAPLYQAASELLERCAVVAFDLTHINDLMMLVRDDLAMIGRGVAWCRYESPKATTTIMNRSASITRTGEISCIRCRATGAR